MNFQNNEMKGFSIALIVFLVLVSCQSNFTPKPKGYFRIEFPEKEYQTFSSNYPYSFEFGKYSVIVKDTINAEPFWLNIETKQFNSKIHISYKPINGNIAKFLNDAHTLAYKHTIKADAINEQIYVDELRKVYGLIYDIEGNAASSVQFYITDSTKHFLRGALYFNSVPNNDSLAPSINFFRKDIVHLIETIKWNK